MSFTQVLISCYALVSQLVAYADASPLAQGLPNPTKIPVLLHQFPNGSWVENIITLTSGRVLVTLLNSAELVLVDPATPDEPTVVYRSSEHTALLGLAQPYPGSLAVVHGNISQPRQISTPGTFGIDLFSLSARDTVVHTTTIAVPGASMLDGLTALPRSSRYLLSADPVLGLIWRIDLLTGAAEEVLKSGLLQPRPNTTTASVNGIHVQEDYLYFTNSNTASFGRIKITDEGLPATQVDSQGMVLTQDFNQTTYDDFALGPKGSGVFYLCSATGPSINKFDIRTGLQTVFAGGPDDKSFDHPIAAMLGKSPKYRKTLFVTTAGIIPGVGGIGGGQIFTVDID